MEGYGGEMEIPLMGIVTLTEEEYHHA